MTDVPWFLLILRIWIQWASFSAMLNSVKMKGKKRKTAVKASEALIQAAAVYMFQRMSSAPNTTPSSPIPTRDDWITAPFESVLNWVNLTGGLIDINLVRWWIPEPGRTHWWKWKWSSPWKWWLWICKWCTASAILRCQKIPKTTPMKSTVRKRQLSWKEEEEDGNLLRCRRWSGTPPSTTSAVAAKRRATRKWWIRRCWEGWWWCRAISPSSTGCSTTRRWEPISADRWDWLPPPSPGTSCRCQDRSVFVEQYSSCVKAPLRLSGDSRLIASQMETLHGNSETRLVLLRTVSDLSLA